MELQHLSHQILAEPRQGAGAQQWTRTIQGAFRSLTPEMGMWAEMESLQGPTLSQLADLQACIEALGPYTIYTDGGWEYREMEWMPLSTRTLTLQATREGAALCSSLLT